MTLATYPLDNIDYAADDAALFHSTRTTGIFADDDFTYSLSGADNTIKLGVGLAWMRLARFKGIVTALKTETSVDMGLPDSVYPRIDHVVLQYDANQNNTQIVVKSGAAASSPLPPERATSEALYEIHLLRVRREPGATAVTAKDVTDLRLNAEYCGLMADAVTRVDTSGINAQVTALIEKLRLDLAAVEAETYYASKDYVGTTAELKKLQFSSVLVPIASFVSDTTYADYPYRAAVALSGVVSTMIPEVIFGLSDAVGGNFAPVAESYNGGVYVYAGSPPDAAITIPTIILWRSNA